MAIRDDEHEKDIRRRVVHPDVQAVLRYFDPGHLPEPLQSVSNHVHALALLMAGELPPGHQTVLGLHRLLEAKDCFVRAVLDIESPENETERSGPTQAGGCLVCPGCGLRGDDPDGPDILVARDMLATRACGRCHRTWLPADDPPEAGGPYVRRQQ